MADAGSAVVEGSGEELISVLGSPSVLVASVDESVELMVSSVVGLLVISGVVAVLSETGPSVAVATVVVDGLVVETFVVVLVAIVVSTVFEVAVVPAVLIVTVSVVPVVVSFVVPAVVPAVDPAVVPAVDTTVLVVSAVVVPVVVPAVLVLVPSVELCAWSVLDI